jgi:hypothetical protein
MSMEELQYFELGVFKGRLRKKRRETLPRIKMMMDRLQANFAGVIPA